MARAPSGRAGSSRPRKQSERECLKPCGRLYVDTITSENLERPDAELQRYPVRLVNGRSVHLEDRVFTDLDARIRTWRPTLWIDDEAQEFVRYSHYLPHSELVEAMKKCGLSGVTKCRVDGEHYDVFVAEKL